MPALLLLLLLRLRDRLYVVRATSNRLQTIQEDDQGVQIKQLEQGISLVRDPDISFIQTRVKKWHGFGLVGCRKVRLA